MLHPIFWNYDSKGSLFDLLGLEKATLPFRYNPIKRILKDKKGERIESGAGLPNDWPRHCEPVIFTTLLTFFLFQKFILQGCVCCWRCILTTYVLVLWRDFYVIKPWSPINEYSNLCNIITFRIFEGKRQLATVWSFLLSCLSLITMVTTPVTIRGEVFWGHEVAIPSRRGKWLRLACLQRTLNSMCIVVHHSETKNSIEQ